MRSKKSWVVLSFVLLILCLVFLFLESNIKKTFQKTSSIDVVNTLNTLPKDDRESIDCFFRCLFRDSFPYVLFGNKPMAIELFLQINPYHASTYSLADFMDLSIGIASPEQIKLFRGWEVWKKYQHLFPSSDFLLFENQGSEYVTIVMINKNSFLNVVEENIVYFREVLGEKISPKILLNNCQREKDIFRDVLNSHEGLLGILLGYGSHNSKLFSRRGQIRNFLDSRKASLIKRSPLTSKECSKLEAEYHHINERLGSFNESQVMDFNPLLLMLPSFVADNSHPETQQLRVEYMKQYRNIINRYRDGDFLEITLNQFVNKNY
jgi:hypothetical protein